MTDNSIPQLNERFRPAAGTERLARDSAVGERAGAHRHIHRRLNKGFTLTELLVVIAIIGMLAALIVPTLSRVKRRAHTTVCRSNLRQIVMTLQMYVDEHKCYPICLGPRKPPGERRDMWYSSLDPYAGKRGKDSVFHCPSYNGPDSPGFLTGVYVDISLLPCHWLISKRVDSSFWASYGYNAMGIEEGTATYVDGRWTGVGLPVGQLGLGGAYMGSNATVAPFTPCAESQVKAPAEMIAVADAILRPVPEGRFTDRGDGVPGHHNARRVAYYGLADLSYLVGRSIQTVPGDGNAMARKLVMQRHGGVDNVAFCDGHVEALPQATLFGATEAVRRRWCNDNQPHDLQSR